MHFSNIVDVPTLDISAIKAHVLHQAFEDNPKLEKTQLIKQLADGLVKLQMLKPKDKLWSTNGVSATLTIFKHGYKKKLTFIILYYL